METPEILLPVVALVLWSHVVLLWMAATRLPALAKLKAGPELGQRTAELSQVLAAKTMWKGDNYNHLMEHPTTFYATALCLAVMGMGSGINLTLAWAYVGLRVTHSLVHCTVNIVPVRFLLFLLSVGCVIWMGVNALMAMI